MYVLAEVVRANHYEKRDVQFGSSGLQSGSSSKGQLGPDWDGTGAPLGAGRTGHDSSSGRNWSVTGVTLEYNLSVTGVELKYNWSHAGVLL